MKVLVKEKIADSGIEKLRAEGFDVTVAPEMPAEEMMRVIGDYEGLVVRSATKVTAEVIEAAKNMKVIGRAGVGVDNVDVAAATKRGIIVCNAPSSNVISAAEHTIALLLAQARNIPQAVASLREGKWERSKFGGTEVYDKTLGIVGMGRIGTLVAARAQGLGMRCIGHDPYVSKERFAQLKVEGVDSFDELLAQADFITVHLPKTAETIGMFGEEEFAKMKDGVRLVNTARGGIYQEEALMKALESGKVASVGIDVYPSEPCTDSPLFGYEQVVATPHLGASTSEAQDRAGTQIAEYVAAALKGQFVPTAVNIAAVPPEVLEILSPFLPLSEQIGKLYTHLAEGQVKELEIEFAGDIAEYDTHLLATALLKGVFEHVVDEPINYVNAPLMAEERGIMVRETKSSQSRDYANLVTLTGDTEKGSVTIAGTLLGPRNEPRLVRLYDFEIDMVPSEHMAFFRYVDKPGMIGKVGTVMGENNINIGSMQVGRKKAGGTAVMGINVDQPIPADVLEQAKRQAGIEEAWSIDL
ncbi:MAG: phosphoglycerate dehydrogenase [Actinobacteria bacterium]|nr:MAG: phosphoglycerate dehydrogenase [Actinomycetota bacterium]